MLVSNRFTKVITEITKVRLSKVLDNKKPMTRREKNHGAVVAIQAALSDLNQGYLASAEVDGFFGKKTSQAIELFQRDYGLLADGFVGRQTLTELDQVFSNDLFREPQGMSIHVGVNFVDKEHYGSLYQLSACVNDAKDFRDMARSLGYSDMLLINEEATTSNISALIRQAAEKLFLGDHLFVTFSGHGSQLINTSPDSESDGMDETLCFYDRMMIDDEIYELLSEIRLGVNVTMLYDSCHSATVSKVIDNSGGVSAEDNIKSMMRRIGAHDPEQPDTVGDEEAANKNRFTSFETKELTKALEGGNAKQVSHTPLAEEKVKEINDAIIETGVKEGPEDIRYIKSEEVTRPGGIYEKNKPLYDAVKIVLGDREQESLECYVVAFSACQDNQTTLDGTANGLYSGNVLGTWDSAGFNGSIQQLHKRLVTESLDPSITPALHTYGGSRAKARLYERPFAF